MGNGTNNAFRVNQQKRVVVVYRLSLAESDYKIIERYKALGYEIEMLERTAPRKRYGIKRDDIKNYFYPVLEKYDNNLYLELEKRNRNKENMLSMKSWLKEQLENTKVEELKKYVAFEEFIRQCKKIEEDRAKEESKDSKDRAQRIATAEAINIMEHKNINEIKGDSTGELKTESKNNNKA